MDQGFVDEATQLTGISCALSAAWVSEALFGFQDELELLFGWVDTGIS
jgi:hypothetical protein